MHEVLQQIGKVGIVPVIAINDAQQAVPLARALVAGGIPCAEVTFRTAAAEESIRRVAAEVPEILLGAGTVLTCEQADRAVAAGAKFIVSPGFNPAVVRHCNEKGIPVTPGCSSPSDMEAALELGLEVVKFFPAEQSGGLDYIKAVAAPYRSLRFMPTGGINAGNIAKYMSYDRILACGGSWMVKSDLIDGGRFDEISQLCREAMLTMLGFEVVHVGINCENDPEALGAAKLFASLFGFSVKEGNSSVFAGKGIELMKSPYLGRHGHIAVAVTSVQRGAAYLERQGIALNADSLKQDGKGVLAIYLQDEIAGFAVHLVRK